MSTVALAHGACEVLVAPEIGGSIARFTWKGHDILRRASDEAIAARNVRAMASYPLIPYSNRIAYGLLDTGRAQFQLRKNFPPEPHAIHGIGWKRPWLLGSHDSAEANLTLSHAPDDDWPFALSATQRFALTENTLAVRLEITNTDAREMPVGLGFHPYFAKPATDDLALHAVWDGRWNMGADKLPTTLASVSTNDNFTLARSVKNWQVDHCFTGWNGKLCLASANYGVEMEASEACKFIVCYGRGAEGDFVALEPATHINSAFALEAAGVTDTGTRPLASGESFSIEMKMRVVPAGTTYATSRSAGQ